MPIAPNAPVTVTLEAQHWPVVMNTLSLGAYRDVALVLKLIHEQLEAAEKAPMGQIIPFEGAS